MASEKPVHWIGSSKRDYLAFPEPVQSDLGYALGVAQLGGKHPKAKPWKGQGPGVLELVESHDGDAYRAIYTVRFEEAIYVLHAFQKKARRASGRHRRMSIWWQRGWHWHARSTRQSDE